ncbi:MAG: hypothetical protein R6T89_00610 [Candidatus Syntrophosphaera sp.]
MQKPIYILTVCFALMVLSSCSMLFKTPRLEKVHGVDVLTIDPDKTVVDVSLSVNNPNFYKLVLDDLDVLLLDKNRNRIGMVALKQAVEIPKKRSNALDFQISLDTRRTVKMVNHSDQTVYIYISGEGRGKVLGIGKNFNFEEPFEIDIKKELENVVSGFKADGQDIFKIKRSYIGKMGLAKSSIGVDFIILNPYGLQFTLSGFPATIRIGGRDCGSGDIAEPLSFDETVYSREGTMTFRISNWNTVVNAVKGAFKGEIEYRVDGNVQIGAYGMDIDQPFSYSDKIYVNLADLVF